MKKIYKKLQICERSEAIRATDKIAASLRSSQIRIAYVVVAMGLSFFSFRPMQVHAALLYSQAANQDVFQGQTFVVDWYLDTEAKSVNSIDLKLNFSTSTLKVDEASSGNSLISLWIKNPKADNDQGTLELTGGIPNGASSDKIPVFRTVFEAKTAGAAFVRLDPSSQILLNDGSGSTELLKFKNLEFNVYPKDFIPMKISSPSHPDQNQWYTSHDVVIAFTPKPDEDYSYSFSSNPELIPTNEKQSVGAQIKYDSRPDGIYYFKLNSKVGTGNWKEAGVFRIQIDSTPPELFTPVIGSDSSIFGGSKFVSFSTVDKMSGISHYKVKVGLFGRSVETQTPYKLYKPLIGDKLIVSAYDRAGNVQQSEISWPGYISGDLFKWILILIGLITLGFAYFKSKK